MKDLTKGNPVRLILEFAIPLYLGNLFQLFYNLADTRIVGQILGENALAAVGATSSLNSLLLAFIVGIGNGFSIMVSRYYGAGRMERMRRMAACVFALGGIITIFVSLMTLGFLNPLLLWMNVPQNLLGQAGDYIKVLITGMLITALYNMCAAVLRALGDSVTPLLFLIVAVVLNICLDLLFILNFHLGVEGAAYATLLAQLISALACLIYMWRRFPILHSDGKPIVYEEIKKDIVQMLTYGLSMGFMNSLVNIGSLVLQTAINTFGNNIIVAHTTARKLTEMFMMPFGVLGMTMTTYCSQNLGAGKYSRIKEGLKKALWISWIWCVIVLLISYTLTPVLVRLITASKTKEVIDTAFLYMRVDTVLYWVTAVIIIVRNAMQGVGDQITPLVSSMIEMLCKILAVFLLVPELDYMGIILTEPISWVLMVIPLLISLRRNKVFGYQKMESENIEI